MKVWLSVEALAPQLTGIGRYTLELARRLSDIETIQRLDFFRAEHISRDFTQWLNPRSQISQTERAQRWINRRLIPVSWRHAALKRALGRSIFHGPNYFLPPWVERGLITIHDLSVFKFPETHPGERLHQFERDFPRSLAHACHIITDSQFTRSEVIEFLGLPAHQVTAVPLGVDPAFRPAAPESLSNDLQQFGLEPQQYVLCVATIEPRKRIDCLLDAYRALPAAERRNFPLVLVGGSGWLHQALDAEIERAQSEGWVRRIGFVSNSELQQLYAGARLFVFPSVYEGFGLPVLEAMASGVAVVASDCSSIPEILLDCGRLVEPGNVSAWTEAIRAGIEDGAWRIQASRNGLARSRDFTWERCASETADVYAGIST